MCSKGGLAKLENLVPGPSNMTHEEFETLVNDGVAALPLWVREQVVNVAFLVKDEPSRAERKEHGLRSDETLFGLYNGVPLIERGDAAVLMPDTITIFKKPILETYDKPDDIRACIENTIWHEVAHYFGHDETWVEAEERRRGKEL